MSSGSSRADRAVEPTRSQIITVRCRRSGSSPKAGSLAVSVGAGATPSSSAIARRILRRCPSRTPRSLRSCSVRSRMTERSMPLSANRWAYSLRPIDASHSAMPFMARSVDGVPHHTRLVFRRHRAMLESGARVRGDDYVKQIASLQLGQHGRRFLNIPRVEAFGETAVDGGESVERLGMLALPHPKPGQVGCRPKLERSRLLAARYSQSLVEQRLCLGVRRAAHEQRVGL